MASTFARSFPRIGRQLNPQASEVQKRLMAVSSAFYSTKVDIPGVPVLGTDPAQPQETVGVRHNHVMMRIKSPEASLKFYGEALGMRTIFTVDTGLWKIYFLQHPSHPEQTAAEMLASMGPRTGMLELFHIPHHPQDKYSNGNEPGHDGFGHIGFSAPDVKKIAERVLRICPDTEVVRPLGTAPFETMQVPKRAGKGDEAIADSFKELQKQFWLCRDPDGYIVEIIPQVVKH